MSSPLIHSGFFYSLNHMFELSYTTASLMKGEYMSEKKIFTSESVTEGHPDKVCDQIADAVLDDILANDPDAHVACEVTACTGEVHLMGEITSSYVPDYEAIARKVIAEIGYTVPVVGFDADHILHVGTMTADEALAQGLGGVKGHRSVGGMRASIYNAMTYEGVDNLASFMEDFQKTHA